MVVINTQICRKVFGQICVLLPFLSCPPPLESVHAPRRSFVCEFGVDVLVSGWCCVGGAGGWRLRRVVGGAEVAGGICWWLVVVVFPDLTLEGSLFLRRCRVFDGFLAFVVVVLLVVCRPLGLSFALVVGSGGGAGRGCGSG
jgi:hypothetical protein